MPGKHTPEELNLRWNKAAAKDGPGTCGSEWIDDPERVFARVREFRDGHMERHTAAFRRSSSAR